MNKSVCVVYIPLIPKSERMSFIKRLKKSGMVRERYDMLIIEDPVREKAEVEVFFNPYQNE